MLEKITFRNGVILGSSTLNEVQKGTTFNPRLPRENYYGLPTVENESIWYINERDGIKDWEFSDPDIEPQSNVGRLAYDGIVLGCNNCDVNSLPEEELEVQYGPPRVTYRDLLGNLLPQSGDGIQTFGVFVNSGSFLNSSGEKISWGLNSVIVEEGLNYIYYDIENAIIVANTILPNKTTPHIPLGSINIEPLTEENNEFSRVSYTDLRPGVFIYSDDKIELNNNDTIIIDDHTLSSWERIFVDTSNGSINITLPQNAVNGDRVAIFDVSGTFDIYPATLYIENNTDSTILREHKNWELNKRFSHTELIYFEPLDIWVFSDHDLNLGTRQLLGEFISCGGIECLGVTEPIDCPNNQAIPAVYPNPSEGFFEYRDDGKCYKIIDDNIAVYSDGEGRFIKIFNSPRCSKNSVLPNLINRDSKTIYVNSILGNDSIQNQGLDENTPLRTIERAILEAVNSKSIFTIKLSPGEYYIDNRPSYSPSGVTGNRFLGFYNLIENPSSLKVSHFREKENLLAVYDGLQDCQDLPPGLELGRTIYSESGAYGTIVYAERDKKCKSDCGWRFTLEGVFGVFNPNDLLYYQDFSSFNSLDGGLIIPKGISIIGEDTRKTVIRPLYVPGDNQSDSNILRLSANSYISNITIGDNLSTKRSHNKLTAISFVSQLDMIDDIEANNRGYYYKVSSFLNKPEILDRFKINLDSEIVAKAPLDRDLRFQDIKENITGENNSDKDGHPDLIRYPGAISIRSLQDVNENVSIPDINSSYSGSPYIKDCTVRSIFGLNGLHANGDLVSGFKSIIADSFTVISIQVDPIAYEGEELTYFSDPASKNSPKKFKPDYRHFAYKASNQAFIQTSSAFVIGAAEHFCAEDGGELSLIGSNSSFGDTSLRSSGFHPYAFTQDYAEPSTNSAGTRITEILPPKRINDNLLSKRVSTGFKFLYDLSKLYYQDKLSPREYRLYIESEDSLNPFTETSPPNINFISPYTFTKKNPNGDYKLSGESYRRNYIYVTGTDNKVYKSLPIISSEEITNDDSKIFKYDPDPTSSLRNLKIDLGSGVLNISENTVTVSKTSQSLGVKKSSYLEINEQVFQVLSIREQNNQVIITTQTSLSNLNSGVNYNIYELKTNIEGGKWYIEVKNEGIDSSVSDLFLSSALNSPEIKVINGQSLFIIRDEDIRSSEEKLYKVRLEGFLSNLGVRDPQMGYIIQKQKDLSEDIILNDNNHPYVLTNVEKTDLDGIYKASIVTSDKYRDSLTKNIIPTLNLDNPDDFSGVNITENSINTFVKDFNLRIFDKNNNEVLYSDSNSFSSLINQNEPYTVFAKTLIGSSTDFRIKLHRPSTIRSNSHHWEWVGYLSYDTAIPKFQGPKFSDSEIILKLFNETSGGVIYASGTDQDGEFYINNTPFSQIQIEANPSITEDIRTLEPQDSIYINKEVYIGEGASLKMYPGSSTIFYGDNSFLGSDEQPITIDSNTSILATTERAGLTQLADLQSVRSNLLLKDSTVTKSVVITDSILANLNATTNRKGLVSLSTNPSDVLDSFSAITPAALNNLDASDSKKGLVRLAPPGPLLDLNRDDIAVVPSNIRDISISQINASQAPELICDIRLSHSNVDSYPTIENTNTQLLSKIYLHGSKVSLYNPQRGWVIKSFTQVLAFECVDIFSSFSASEETYELFLGLDSNDELLLSAKEVKNTTFARINNILVDSLDTSKRYVGRITVLISNNNPVYLQYLGGEIQNLSDPTANESTAPQSPTIGLVNYTNRKSTVASYIFGSNLEYNYKYLDGNSNVVINNAFASLVGEIDITTVPEEVISGNLSITNGKVQSNSRNNKRVLLYNYDGATSVWNKNAIEFDAGNSPKYKYVDMSKDGTTIAVGDRQEGLEGIYSGKVTVYKLSGSTWGASTPLAAVGNSPFFMGYSVCLSSNGNTLLVKTHIRNQINQNLNFYINVFRYDTTTQTWNNLNFPVVSNVLAIDSPYSVDLSNDGNVVAYSYYNQSQATNEAVIYSYDSNSSNWTQSGNTLQISAANQAGWSLSLNTLGNRIAIGAPAANNNRGSISVYFLNNDTWEFNNILQGVEDNDFFGYSLDLQTVADSERLVVGAPGARNYTGYVRSYYTSGTPIVWNTLDGILYGNSTGEESGSSVSYASSTEHTIAFGSKFRNSNGEKSGQVLVYADKNTNSDWDLLGDAINGSGPEENLGTLVSLHINTTTSLSKLVTTTEKATKYKDLLTNDQNIHTQGDSITVQVKPRVLQRSKNSNINDFEEYNQTNYYTSGEISHELSTANSIFHYPVKNDCYRIKLKYDYRISNVSNEILIPEHNESILRKYKLNTTSDDSHRKNGILVSINV